MYILVDRATREKMRNLWGKPKMYAAYKGEIWAIYGEAADEK